jgi:hypothetical protein
MSSSGGIGSGAGQWTGMMMCTCACTRGRQEWDGVVQGKMSRCLVMDEKGGKGLFLVTLRFRAFSSVAV